MATRCWSHASLLAVAFVLINLLMHDRAASAAYIRGVVRGGLHQNGGQSPIGDSKIDLYQVGSGRQGSCHCRTSGRGCGDNGSRHWHRDRPGAATAAFRDVLQADALLDRTGSGLGIGLSVAKRLVELHGGSVDGRSEGLGKGSEFTVRLPILREPENKNHSSQEEARESSARLSSTTHRVLIVDDNSDTVESVAEIARSWGHEVAVAQDGPSALELASAFRPDIALLDIGLPQMNGYELARRLREMIGMNRMLLVAITGYTGEEDRHTSHEAGFDLHLVKPVDPIRLENLLAHLS